MYIRFSKRRLIAGSSCHGIFVAPSTSTPVSSLPTPCICTRLRRVHQSLHICERAACTHNSVLIRRDASDSPSPRVPASESTSSIKIIAGFCSLAIVKSCLTSRSDSPIHLLTRSDDETEKNVLFASVATAFARNDLPVPGGPYRRIPRQGVRLPVNKCGNLMGRITASFSASLAESSPATSSHDTFGVSDIMADISAPRSFFASASSPSPALPFTLLWRGGH